MTNGNEPICAAIYRQTGDETSRIATKKDIEQGQYLIYTEGLTKRELFSAMAMQGILAKHGLPADGWDRDNLQEKLESATFASVTLADALIKALNQQ